MRKSYLWAGLFTLAIGAWLGSSYVFPKAEPKTEEKTETTASLALFKVRVRTYEAIMREAVISARGVTEASKRVEVRARTNGLIESSPVEQGQSVAQGDILCKLDMATRHAQLAQAKAALASAERDYNATVKLNRKGIESDAKVASQKAGVDAAEAALKLVEWDIGTTDVTAPVNGILVEKPTEAGSFLEAGKVCATISVLDPILVTAQVGERYIPYLREGMEAGAKLATGQTIKGQVRLISKIADLATRTFRVELEVKNAKGDIRAGVTSELFVPLPPVPAHRLPASVLGLNDKGQFGVRVLKPDDTTQFMPVQVIAQETDGMWVAGLPSSVPIVTLGQDYVKDGEKVEPVKDVAEAAK